LEALCYDVSMYSDKTMKETRALKSGWNIISEGDNGFDLLQFIIKVKDIRESSQTADTISLMLIKYERPDDVFNTQISLRDWRVEIQLALPSNTWGTPAQQDFTTLISAIYS